MDIQKLDDQFQANEKKIKEIKNAIGNLNVACNVAINNEDDAQAAKLATDMDEHNKRIIKIQNENDLIKGKISAEKERDLISKDTRTVDKEKTDSAPIKTRPKGI